MEGFLPPWESERGRRGVVWSCQTTSDPRLPWRTNTPAARGSYPASRERPARSQRDDDVTEERRGVSMSDLSLTQTQTHRKPRIQQLPWVAIIWDGSLLSGPTALIYISITPDRWRKESPTSASGCPDDHFHYRLFCWLFFPINQLEKYQYKLPEPKVTSSNFVLTDQWSKTQKIFNLQWGKTEKNSKSLNLGILSWWMFDISAW